ncbi:hypothetical protein LshimejAT787_0201230 [Lyophyllum shimeji]|uniref:Uncharacterized protein n=1 Tax=Lyophyllum shimeji TaxID=47721 RepID=A0A9P3PEQ7_LYOSH|nr:hypothetical protein LshimejAT787_0201230 [Lyophyllum shimeji]
MPVSTLELGLQTIHLRLKTFITGSISLVCAILEPRKEDRGARRLLWNAHLGPDGPLTLPLPKLRRRIWSSMWTGSPPTALTGSKSPPPSWILTAIEQYTGVPNEPSLSTNLAHVPRRSRRICANGFAPPLARL